MNTNRPDNKKLNIREELLEAIAHLEHILPGQAPIRDFVHHNTLHGFQHLDFTDAIAESRRVTGAKGFLPHEKYREYFQAGRIDGSDIDSVLDEDESLSSDEVIASIEGVELSKKQVYRAGLLYDFKSLTHSQLHWLIEEKNILSSFQQDISEPQRKKTIEAAGRHGLTGEAEIIEDLWSACLQKLDLEHFIIHPEDMTDLSASRAESMINDLAQAEQGDDNYQVLMHHLVRKKGERLLSQQLDSIGAEYTLGDFLKSITGEDILNDLRPVIIRHVGLFLDDGMASWPYIDHSKGFYNTWRVIAKYDLTSVFEDLRDWHDTLDGLSDDPLDTMIFELRRSGVPQEKWAQYIERIALELPGWAGMFLWHANNSDAPNISMVDYLAVCLVLERLFAQRLCGRVWQLEASQDMFRWYFSKHRSEYLVRHALFNSHLPEYLITRAHRLVQRQYSNTNVYHDWIDLADMIWTWQNSPAADQPRGYSIHGSAWSLFRLSQHLSLPGAFIRELDDAQLEKIFACLDLAQGERGGFLWLQAYERNYREKIFNVVRQNNGRGRWRTREARPSAQITFCMDEREEGIRRHLEDIEPSIETLGAAGFFGVAVNWRGLDEASDTPLCPVVVTPVHAVHEHAQQDQQDIEQTHIKRRNLRLWIKDLLHFETRRNVLTTGLVIGLSGPFALLTLVSKILFPGRFGRWLQSNRDLIDTPVNTQVQINAQSDEPATIEHPRHGFTDEEQADRVENFLRTIGLVTGYAPFVIMMGHGSSSQNNPHMAAYDCGACSGRHGGPNARIFAAMANRPEIRERLQQRGLDIPQDTVFLGAEHNTCDEVIEWYDMDQLSDAQSQAWQMVNEKLDQACRLSAHERSRRFMSASTKMDNDAALAHVVARSYDFSQARPELGHATNATAFIGRRSLSQGAFFDRRAFLISYDPSTDPEGKIVENILLNAGPVGAGINLEYYFSTVNNEKYGCGTKIMHNLTGLFGVMEGASSDLRTGLPVQMIEIHEAMRLLVMVEAKTEILGAIYQHQPVIQELVGKRWIQLAAIDPDDGAISFFVAGKGFVPWDGDEQELAMVKYSVEHYQGQRDHLSPALLELKQSMEAAGA
ncbi:MAG: DUF2309 domain-containing protein [Gammaproteobacteria bacterium]|nr:DUF2309 domain-containing protein [Gammaproteobacteria bacterium]